MEVVDEKECYSNDYVELAFTMTNITSASALGQLISRQPLGDQCIRFTVVNL